MNTHDISHTIIKVYLPFLKINITPGGMLLYRHHRGEIVTFYAKYVYFDHPIRPDMIR
jgi:hypothetical protein